MSKKMIIAVCLIFALIVICFIIREKKGISNFINIEIEKFPKLNVVYDENSDEYVIYDSENGKEIARSQDKSELVIYEIDPDYKPAPFGQPGDISNIIK